MKMIARSLSLGAMMAGTAMATSPLLCNMADEGEGMDFSLADLADLDTTDVQEMRYESLPAGAYIFEVTKAELTEGANRETNEKQFIVEFGFKVVEVKAVTERGVDKDSLIDKVHTEKRYIIPGPKAEEGIGYLRAFMTDMGANSAGRLGGVPGGEPGILDESIGQQFPAKITKKPDRNDPTIKYARMRIDAPKK